MMTLDRIIPHNSPCIPGRRALQCIIILCALVATSVAEASISYNSSTIHVESQNSNIRAPVSISAGNGYYLTHPVNYDSAAASRTQVSVSGLPAASLHHSVGSAKEISGSREYTVSSNSYQESGSEQISTTTIGMKIDETVTEGRVNIGAFQADLSSGGNKGMKNPWKNPALEIEEEYIGTYHISKNMSITSSNIIHREMDFWLVPGIDYLNFYPPKSRSITASDVFNCLKCS